MASLRIACASTLVTLWILAVSSVDSFRRRPRRRGSIAYCRLSVIASQDFRDRMADAAPCGRPCVSTAAHRRSAGKTDHCFLDDNGACFLYKMAGLGKLQRRRAVPDSPAQHLHRWGPEYRVLHANRHETLAFPVLGPELARTTRKSCALRVRPIRYEVRESSDAGFVSRVGIWSRIGGCFVVTQRWDRSLHESCDVHVGRTVRECAPSEETFTERRVASPERGVHDEEALEAILHVHRDRQTNKATPILTDQHYVIEIERLDQSDYSVAMEVESVGRLIHRLVGATKAVKIRRDRTQTRREKRGNHFAIEIRPRGLAMQAERDMSIVPHLVEVMHS